jgi:hypothetical protein
VQHEILTGTKIGAFTDSDYLTIKVSAQGDSGQTFDEAIPYGLAVTLEVSEESKIQVYESVRAKLGIPIKVPS